MRFEHIRRSALAQDYVGRTVGRIINIPQGVSEKPA